MLPDDTDFETITKLPRIGRTAMWVLIDMLTHGYTARIIAKRLFDEFQVQLSDAQIIRAGVQYAPQIEAYRKELDQVTLKGGLARSTERVRRLAELAESWETKARGDGEEASSRAAQVYIRAIEAIGKESEAMGLVTQIDPEDPWVQLLGKLHPEQQPRPIEPLLEEPPSDQTETPSE